MTGFVRHPWLAAAVFVAWLAVAEQVTWGQVVLAGIASLAASWVMAALRVERALPRRPRAMLRLAHDVTRDIVRSNLAVAWLALSSRRAGHAAFLGIPLDLRDRTGLAVLACIITATPGTIWVSYDASSGWLLIHVLDLVSEEEWLETIKHRYERQLMEIFE